MSGTRIFRIFASSKKREAFLLAFLLLSFGLKAVGLYSIPALLPMPQSVVWRDTKFPIPANGEWLVKQIVSHIPGVKQHEKEAYLLEVDGNSALLSATTQEGLFRGLQTVNQLFFIENGTKYLAGCTILDWPAFEMRGFMQDVGRNFMPIALLKEQIDVLAAYKFNVFHFHVTDNPGWRLESKKYPSLHEISSMSRWPGKYYTKEDFLELVNYCRQRYITLIPELDVPGHCEAFRKAFALDSMSDHRVQPILTDLVDELCSWVSREEMPYLHLGTDEVWQKHEKPAPGLLSALLKHAQANGRSVIVWSPGQSIEGDTTSITQLWSSAGKPKPGHRYLDSRLNYLNHLDPLAGIAQLYFDRICRKSQGDSLALGGILCCWNDNNVSNPSDILAQNPVYPGMLTYSETSWKGQPVNLGNQFLAKLPGKESPLYQEFVDFENRLIAHRDRFFRDKPFPYLRQSDMEWRLAGPFDEKRDEKLIREIETSFGAIGKVLVDSAKWMDPVVGGTIHINHFFGYPSYIQAKQGIIFASSLIWSPIRQEVDSWIGFQDWSRSGGRRGGPFPIQGQWHNTNAKVWLNGEEIAPPVWNHPGLGIRSEEIPFSDENYFFRKPTKIFLKKGWNSILLKIPKEEKGWKWMFTFMPFKQGIGNPEELTGLKFSAGNNRPKSGFRVGLPFGEHMVLQQKKAIELFGDAKSNDLIHLVLGMHSVDCRADETGKWKGVLPSLPAGGPYVLQIFQNGQKVIEWKDILVGEVWFCSGQSNMEFKLSQAKDGVKEAVLANDPMLRLMNFQSVASTADVVWDSLALNKVNHYAYLSGSWQLTSPGTASNFSAIAYFFGKEMRRALAVPVGLIEVAVGGAPAESFVNGTLLKGNPLLANLLTDWQNNPMVMDWCRQRAQKNLAAAIPLLQRHPFMPGYLFDAGIAPFGRFSVKGILWYQGESNAENPGLYEVLFPSLVNSWRQSWQDPNLPFLFAQLSSIQRNGWEYFRDSQRRMAGNIPFAGMVVTSDLGDSLNVHPIRKKEIANRFALMALQKVYGCHVEAEGPMPIKAEQSNGRLEVYFSHALQLRTSDATPVKELEIAGADSVFRPVEATICQDRLEMVTGKQVVKYLRYGWKPFSRGNLINEMGLPTSTFCIITH